MKASTLVYAYSFMCPFRAFL
uniref:Uncharacterized protein n=1 Tax=Arundo donax TaxID=35708 RepID=A0A0A8ZLB4_ARUDO